MADLSTAYSRAEPKGEEYAPKLAVCPYCGAECSRHSKRPRRITDITLDGAATHTVTVGVYKCVTCDKHFVFQPPGLTKGKHYADRARTKAIQAVVQDRSTFEGVPSRLSRDFHIQPSSSSVYRWTHQWADDLNFDQDYTKWAVENFSGALEVDEMYDHFVILFATDPINDIVVGYQVTDNIGDAEILQFLGTLKDQGIDPEVFISDGSPLYQDSPRRTWPNVKQQQCVFHFVRNVTDDILKCVRKLHKTIQSDAKSRKDPGLADLAHTLWRERYLFVRRPDDLKGDKRDIILDLASQHPSLQLLWQFQNDFYGIYHRSISKRDAFSRRKWIVNDPDYLAFPGLSPIIKRLNTKRFAQTLTYWDYENLPRTSNHVEQANRHWRKRQKSHYRNRTYEAITHMIEADLMERKRTHNGDPCLHLLRR